MPRLEKVTALVKKTLNEHKAEEIAIIDVRDKTPFADTYILANGLNVRHVNALKESIIEAFAKNNIPYNHVEGSLESTWILIDAYHCIINIFTEEERNRISLDELLNQKYN